MNTEFYWKVTRRMLTRAVGIRVSIGREWEIFMKLFKFYCPDWSNILHTSQGCAGGQLDF